MAEQEVVERRGREGGRWINERPTPDEFGTWFKTSMKLDPLLNFEDYIGGVVLIPAVDSKAKVVIGFRNGAPVIEERPELSFIPYAKVETRIDYFWDLVAAHEEWVAVVEHIESPRLPVDPVEEVIEAIESVEGEEAGKVLRTITRRPKPVSALAQMVHQLPKGFSIATVPVGDGYSHFICCTVRVSIYAKEDYAAKNDLAVPLRTGRGTKQVPLLKGSYGGNVWADDSSLMKAETGALGRALGFAGIFVIPGSGVATAEDVLESLSQGQTPSEATPEAPATLASTDAAPARTGAEAAKDEEQELRDRALALYKELKGLSEEGANEFTTWAHGRRLAKVSDAKGAMLRGVVKKLEKLTDEAKRATPNPKPVPVEGGPTSTERESPAEGEQESTGGEPDVPTEKSKTAAGAGEEATGNGDEPSGQAG